MAHIKSMVIHGFKSFAKKTEIPFDKEINLFIGANGSGKCLTGDSLVQLGDGRLERIDEIVNANLANSVKTEDGFIAPGDGTEVMCLDFDSLKVNKKNVKAFVKRTSPGKLLRIKTRSGKEIKTTKYHPLFILKKGKVAPARADELKKGERIAIPRKINFEPEHNYFVELLDLIGPEENVYVPYREEFAFILRSLKKDLEWKRLAQKIGVPLYVIKGVISKQAVQFNHLIRILRFANISDIEIINLIQEIRAVGVNTKFSFKNSPEFARFFGYLLAEGRLTDSSQIWFTNGNIEIVNDYVNLVKKLFGKNPLVREYKPNCWDVIIYSEPLKKLLRGLGMASQTGKKEISNIFLKHSSNDEISNLLNGLYCGDGYVSNSTPTVEIVTKSKELALGIENCLLRLGIVPRKRKVIKRIRESGFSGEYRLVSFYGVDNLMLFNENVDLIHKMKRERIISHLNKKANPNVDLIEVNELVKETSHELGINIKKTRKGYPILSSYCYNGCTPSRKGLSLLTKKVLIGQSEKLESLKKLVSSDIFWDEILEVEEIEGGEWVYDLCVDKDHNFIANNMFVHNSNVAEALCFALGRLSIKSMRAAKAKNLIFMGSKYVKPAKEAYVELIFDNIDKAFSIDKEEVSLKRIVKSTGQSSYKINGETKTRSEVIETLAQAGIDPHGFNLVMQGQIQSIIKMHPDERRRIIEEVAGISIYEARKEKSLKELGKTDERLKEISTILRERTTYLKNLEREKEQAQKYKDSELTIKRCKASLTNKKLKDKEKEVSSIIKNIGEKEVIKEKIKLQTGKIQEELNVLNVKVDEVNKHIQKSSGVEQEDLHSDIANLKAELEGMKVRKENYENRRIEVERRIEEMEKSIPELQSEIENLREKSPLIAKKAEELKKKKVEFSVVENERKKLLTLKTELESLKDRQKDKEKYKARVNADSNALVERLEDLYKEMQHEKEENCVLAIDTFRKSILEKKEEVERLQGKELEHEKTISVADSIKDRAEKVKDRVSEIDVCPVCQSKISDKHKGHVHTISNLEIQSAEKDRVESLKEVENAKKIREKIIVEIKQLEETLRAHENELVNHKDIKERKEHLAKLVDEEKVLEKEIAELDGKQRKLEELSSDLRKVEEDYERKILEIEEISSRTEEDFDTTLLYKERELENIRNVINRGVRDIEEIDLTIDEITESIDEKTDKLQEKVNTEEELNLKFKKLFETRDNTQRDIQKKNISLSETQNEVRQVEDQINYLKIGKAKLDAEKESHEMEMSEYSGVELINASFNVLQDRLRKTQDIMQRIGSINLRALEVYEQVKEEYDKVQDRVDVIVKEKEDILKIIYEIDRKKKKTFMKTFKAINELFSANFGKLYSKGTAYLDIENKENIFDGGISIVVKLAKGKYFDVTSLSGGEQTLIALSLLFAIQEHKPYHFYIFDEIDAALDKRNSERLAALFNQYVKAGQYIVITHNDAIITKSNVLYGVSMQEGVSKILSLRG